MENQKIQSTIPQQNIVPMVNHKAPWLLISILIASFFLLIGVVIGQGISNQNLGKKATSIPTPIVQEQNNNLSPTASPSARIPANNGYEKIFGAENTMIEENIKLEADSGFEIVSSILSNKRDKIVYAETTICLKKYRQDLDEYFATNHKSIVSDCDVNFIVKIKTLDSGEVRTVYDHKQRNKEFPQEISLMNILRLIIKPAEASGKPAFVRFPILWSINDKYIILKDELLIPAQMGGPTIYFYTLNVQNGEMAIFNSIENSIFRKNLSSAVILSQDSKKSKPGCGMMSAYGGNTIELKDLESGKTEILLSGNKIISLKKIIDENNREKMIYIENIVYKEYPECIEFGTDGVEKELLLPN